MLLMGFTVCLFCYLDVLCLWVERVWLGKITRLWTAATAILAELDKEIGLKSNFGQILYKWKNGNNIQVLLTTKAMFFLLRLKKKKKKPSSDYHILTEQRITISELSHPSIYFAKTYWAPSKFLALYQSLETQKWQGRRPPIFTKLTFY